MREGVDGLVQHRLQRLAGTLGQALAGDEQLGLAPGRRQIQGGALMRLTGVRSGALAYCPPRMISGRA
jgi:hypothetical protein